MNDLIEPFLAEARELIEAATDDLIELDRDPADGARVESVFRSFHTLKGSAGLLDLGPMALALHAAEDLLSEVRAGRLAISAAIVDACLGALDRVAGWVTAIETAGALPDGADAQAADLAAALREFIPGQARRAREPAEDTVPGWARELMLRLGPNGGGGRSLTAIRYHPAADCFLNGDDPLAIVGKVPDIVFVEVGAREPWPMPDLLDPFSCNLVIGALSSSPREEVAAAFRLVADQVELAELVGLSATMAGPPTISPLARAIIAEQEALLAGEHPPSVRSGVERSALLSVANAFRHDGFAEQSELLHEAARRGTPDALALVRDTLALPEPATREAPSPGPAPAGAARHVRVDAERLDAVAGLASELTTARNTLGHLLGQLEAGARDEVLLQRLRESDAAIGRLAADLHRSVMSIRMVPLSGVFRRFARPVREMAAQLGKEVVFELSGDETEADRTIADSLFELLLHVLRNAIDHGLEVRQERVDQGKSPQGRLTLAVRPERDRIVITVADDGRGIDPAAIRRAAVSRGLLGSDAAQALADEHVLDLIFAPGFSTASAVTDMSGRGVGMDAVRVGAQRLGGRVEVESRPGLGTTIRLSLPQTMMLTPVMMVRAGSDIWGIPLEAVLELQRIDRDRIVTVKDRRAVTWRDRTVPVLSLAEQLAVAPGREAGREADMLVVVVGGEPVGLIVDAVLGRLEALVRPLGGVFSGLPGLTGTTVLGDGRILLVLDLDEVVQ